MAKRLHRLEGSLLGARLIRGLQVIERKGIGSPPSETFAVQMFAVFSTPLTLEVPL